jgi:hypothetical protein
MPIDAASDPCNDADPLIIPAAMFGAFHTTKAIVATPNNNENTS